MTVMLVILCMDVCIVMMMKLIFLRQASCSSMYGGSVGYGLGWVDENRPTDNSGTQVNSHASPHMHREKIRDVHRLRGFSW